MVVLPKVEIGLNGGLLGSHPVFVEGVHHVRVKGRPEDIEVGIPLGSAEDDDVVGIDLADAGDDAAVKRLEPGVIDLKLREMRDRLVEKIVTENGFRITVVAGDALPYVDGLLLAFWAFEEPGISPAIVDVRAGLAAWGGVHVDHDIQAGLLRRKPMARSSSVKPSSLLGVKKW